MKPLPCCSGTRILACDIFRISKRQTIAMNEEFKECPGTVLDAKVDRVSFILFKKVFAPSLYVTHFKHNTQTLKSIFIVYIFNNLSLL